MTRSKLFPAAAALLLSAGLLRATPFEVDPTHSSVGFKVRHLMISNVKGKFDTFSGSYDLEDGRLSALTGTIETGSVDTGIEKRDAHLKSADFFDAEKYPKITFRMTKFDGGKVIGDLTMHGVTRTVTLKAETSDTIKDPWGLTRSSVSLGGELNRSDFGLVYNQVLEAGGVAIGDEIRLTVELEGIAE